ncbi:MAG: ATP-binding protein [Rhodocyclaceae bacterium]|nr:ATP-binding protein [Rhodocyclaceae bacterium]MDZ4214549.1 ATP-binding protein [Rhodocyclaceae bacterium]
MFKRHLQPLLREALSDTPAVLINGPRQSGKTTLAQQCAEGMPYFSLDDATRLSAARADPQGFIRQIDRAIIDEIQRAPELLLALKLSIDTDRRPGRFLLTGSANIMSLPTIADSLAGRIEVHALLPLSNAEIAGRAPDSPDFLANALAQNWPAQARADTPWVGDALVEHVLAGGYPEMRSRTTAKRRQAWAQAYLTTLVERDIQDVARIDEATRIPQLMAILATLSGQLLNLRQIGGQLGLNAHTAEKYIGVLEKLFLVRRLPAWGRNELGRLVKTPKLHFLDAGLHAALVRASTDLLRNDRSRFGPILESWVFGELLKISNLSPGQWFLAHYRDKDQVEVDFVLESPLRAIIGIEVKASATVTASDFKGLRRLREHCKESFSSGIVLYDGTSALPFGDGLWAVPLGWL